MSLPVDRAWAVVVAGGSGSRFGGPKQFAALAGRPLVEWSLETARKFCDGVVLVLPPGTPGEWGSALVVTGGETRSDSVRAGLAAVPDGVDMIVVHDAARPLAGEALWQAVLEAVEAGADGAIPACPVTDTIKKRTSDGVLVTLERSELVAVQTPQAFRAGAIKQAHAGGGHATDDAALVEAAGGRVVLVEGDPRNIKVTTTTDLLVAEALIKERS
ncbi:MAG TPA: 2-C-methyl-D-erythritol 4-phosphate cytidylyltransferase [Acidimicrobiales bacterium]|nr:2-C-methyl-D-erythritol 4-phosphate cytidylyltransferase [Acidimicrobiales bacterium]